MSISITSDTIILPISVVRFPNRLMFYKRHLIRPYKRHQDWTDVAPTQNNFARSENDSRKAEIADLDSYAKGENEARISDIADINSRMAKENEERTGEWGVGVHIEVLGLVFVSVRKMLCTVISIYCTSWHSLCCCTSCIVYWSQFRTILPRSSSQPLPA